MISYSSARSPLLFAHSYFLRYDEKQTRKMKPYPPLGTLIAAAVARRRGFDVHLFDAMLASGVEEFEGELDQVRPRIVAVLEDDFNFLTKMCTLRMRRAALEMIGAARDRGCRVVVNGADAIDHPELYLEAGAHAVIMGEVETTLIELVEVWTADPDRDLGGVAGLCLPSSVRRGPSLNGARSSLRRTGVRARIDDLDLLPTPAWDLVDVERYRAAWTTAHGRMSWNMVTSRGCPYGCNWCAKPVYGRRYAQRSATKVAAELAELRDHAAPDHVWFADDIFGLTPDWIEEFAREVTRLDARTPFTIQSRVNLMTPRAVAALREAGAEEVWLGVESGSQRVLDAMEKGSRVEQAAAATRTLQDHGIRACWFVQLGYLGEGWEDILLTRDLIRAERPDEIGVSVSYPLPGTPFHSIVRDQMRSKHNWEQTDDLEMLFHGTFTTDFYRRVRNLLHDEVDAMRAGVVPSDDPWTELEAALSEHRNPVAIGG
jgi:anaerobic magnesium-protoporphyrin IX monomethyl ester cyclase